MYRTGWKFGTAIVITAKIKPSASNQKKWGVFFLYFCKLSKVPYICFMPNSL